MKEGRTWIAKIAFLLLCIPLFLPASRAGATSLLPALEAAVHSRITFVSSERMVWSLGCPAAGSCRLLGIDLADGTERWSAPLPGIPSRAVALGTNSFALIHGQMLEARESHSGKILWSTNLAAIPQQVAFKQEWFNGKLLPHELASTNCAGGPLRIVHDEPRGHLLLTLGGTNLLILREESDWSYESTKWSDWLLFEGRAGNLMASGEGGLVAFTPHAALLRRCESNYRISGLKVSRSPLIWPSSIRFESRDFLLNQQDSIRLKEPSFVRVLWDDGSQATSFGLRQLLAGNERWWKAATNLVRLIPGSPTTAEGWSLAGKPLWKVNLPMVDQSEAPLCEWLGEHGSTHYFTDRETVLRVVPHKPTGEQIVPSAGQIVSPDWLHSSFAVAPNQGILLQATGDREWRMRRSGPTEVPTNHVVLLMGRDPSTGKVLWSKSETVAVKRASQ